MYQISIRIILWYTIFLLFFFFFWMIEEQFNFRITSRIEFSLLSIVSILLSTIVPPPFLPLTISDPNFHRFFPLSLPPPPSLFLPPSFCVFHALLRSHECKFTFPPPGLFARQFSPRKKNSFYPFICFQSTFIDLLFFARRFFFLFPKITFINHDYAYFFSPLSFLINVSCLSSSSSSFFSFSSFRN